MVLFIAHSLCRSNDIQRRLASSLLGISQSRNSGWVCKSKRRCSGQEPAHFPPRQTMRRCETRGTRQEVSTSSLQPAADAASPPLSRACGLWQVPVPRFPDLATCNCTFICPCNYCNCDQSCGKGTGKQSVTHPGWEKALPPRSSKQHFQLHLAG